MKAEDSRQVNTGKEESGRNSERALSGAEAGVTTRLRTKAELERESGLMDAVCERGNLLLAYQRVVENKGAAGVDGIGIPEFKAHLKQHWPTIKARLLVGEYMPQPVRRVDIPKPQGGVRTLGIPTLTDRLIQQALHQVLSPIFEATFSDSSYGFRPGRNAHQAVKAARQYVAEGRRIVVDMDLEKLWRQWKRPYTRAKNLMKAGLKEERAWQSACNQRGPWWNSGTSHMNQAFPKSFFDRLGLVSLLDTTRRLQSIQ
jgi:RNA-directed DNA polymerase